MRTPANVMQELFLAVSRDVERWPSAKEYTSFRSWLRRVAHNLVINWLKSPQRRVLTGGSDLHALLEQVPAEDEQSAEFDRELQRAQFRQAAQQVRTEVEPATWQAFWETSVARLSPAEAAAKLGMSVGAVRVAKCRVVARMKAALAEMEKTT